jgi:hypothetical protein
MGKTGWQRQMGRWKQLARVLLVMAMSKERVVFSLHFFVPFVNNPIELGSSVHQWCDSAEMTKMMADFSDQYLR